MTIIETTMFLLLGLVVWIIVHYGKEELNRTKNLSYPSGLEDEPDKSLLQKEYVREQALKYREPLAKKRAQLLVKDDYGDLDDTKWKLEIVDFFNRKIKEIPADLAMSGDQPVISPNDIAKIIDEVASEQHNKTPFDDAMSGHEYEHYCADLLRLSGWEADVSKASNDQGVDIIAKLNGKTVAIQCKKYSKPVGNKAVQEVTAGKQFYDADYAAVVSNNSFTPSAKQLARSTNVQLLHHSELFKLDDHVQRECLA